MSYIVTYNFGEKVRIFFGEICVFWSIILYQTKKERQSLTSLAFNVV